MVSAHHVGKQFGERTLFSDLSFEINEHDKVGLVGENGCGKKIDEAVVYYKKTLEKDANYEGALANLGMCYTILAQEYSQKNSSTNIKDKAKIKKDKEVINGYFKEALPLYEKLRELQPGKVELWGTGLSNCYYNLQMADKLEEVEKLLNNAAE